MDVLDLLLQMDPTEAETQEYRVKRLSRLSGQPVCFRLRGLGYSRVAEIRRQHGQDEEMEVHILLAGVASPDLRDPRLREKYGAATPAELVKRLLLPGEIASLSRAIERLSGFRSETIEEVKKN